MKMNNYIDLFTNHIKSAVETAEKTRLKTSSSKIKNVLICGLGGSGVGGNVINDIVSTKTTIPVLLNKDYSIPGFVNKYSLAIVCSYSGNTEETLSAFEACRDKKAEIIVVTSGGELGSLAEKHKCNKLCIPEGHPPRAMFGYSFVNLFYALKHYGVIDDSFKSDIKNAIDLLDLEKSSIQKKAFNLAKELYNKTPVIYVSSGFEGVGVRFRQQLNENSKMLCWHHVVPEMNHNELLGWRINVKDLSVVYFRNKCDYQKNKIRIDINKKIISNHTQNITEVWSKGDSLVENTLYLINIGDWTSWYLSEMNSVDAIEIDVINFLKQELKKIK